MSETSRARTRRRGGGSITPYETKSGRRWRWQLPVPDADNAGRTRQQGRAGFKTAKEADDDLQTYRRDLRTTGRAVRTSGIPTVAEFADVWVSGLRLAASTVVGYRRLLRNQVIPQIGTLRLDQLNSARLRKHYADLLAEGLSANTVKKAHDVIAPMLDLAVAQGHIAINPARNAVVVNKPTSKEVKANRPEMVRWSFEELNRFLTWDREVRDDPVYPIWYMFAVTGLRRSELLALRWQDLDFDRRRLSLRRALDTGKRQQTKLPKGDRERVIELTDDDLDVLRSHRARTGALALDAIRGDRYVFPGRGGGMRNPNDISTRFTERVREAQAHFGTHLLPTITIHGLRHSHASLLMEEGEHPKVVQERLGHASITITLDLYSHTAPSMHRSAADAFARGRRRAGEDPPNAAIA